MKKKEAVQLGYEPVFVNGRPSYFKE